MVKVFTVFFLVVVSLSKPVRLSAQDFDPPPFSGNVRDDSGKLTDSEKQNLLQEIEILRKEADIWMGIYITPTLSGDSIESAAEKVFRKWELGQRGKDNGLLFIVAIEERKTRLEVGYGLEASVTDFKTGRILRDPALIYFLKKEDYAAASSFVIQKLIEIREGKFKETEPTFLDYPAFQFGLKLSLVLFLYLISISYWIDRKSISTQVPETGFKKYLTLKSAFAYLFLSVIFAAAVAAGIHIQEIIVITIGSVFIFVTLILPSTVILISKYLPDLPDSETKIADFAVSMIAPTLKGLFFAAIVYSISQSKWIALGVGAVVAIITVFQSGGPGSGKSGSRSGGAGSSSGSSSSRSSSGGGRSGGGGSSGSW